MKPQSLPVILLLVCAPIGFAQAQTAPSSPPEPVAAASLQLPTAPDPMLTEEEHDLIQRLEQIENDSLIRATAAEEAMVPLEVFGGR